LSSTDGGDVKHGGSTGEVRAMVAYSFQARFADAVARGEKVQTIRAPRRSRHARPGERVQLFTAMRTKACRRLGEGVCEVAAPVAMTPDGVAVAGEPVDVETFARADGFSSWREMRDWFEAVHGLPFTGHLIRWRLNQ
jgi:hypothetical protein